MPSLLRPNSKYLLLFSCNVFHVKYETPFAYIPCNEDKVTGSGPPTAHSLASNKYALPTPLSPATKLNNVLTVPPRFKSPEPKSSVREGEPTKTRGVLPIPLTLPAPATLYPTKEVVFTPKKASSVTVKVHAGID